MSRNWAFVIGINGYVPTNFPPLSYAKQDAEAMRDFFVASGFEGVWLFTEDSLPQVLPNGDQISTQPTVGNLISLLEDRFAAPFLGNGDNCWFFFAGHGGQERNQDFLMPQDANPRAVERTAISVNYIRERLCRCGADNVILLLDACRTEGARDGRGVGAEHQPGIITVSSCGPMQKSWEIEALGHGAFTYGLLEALRMSGERNCATVERLNQYLRDRVPALCKQHGKFPEQMPRTAADPAEKLHFILQPGRATLADIAVLRTDAYEAEVNGNLELAEQIWIRVIVAAQGRDMNALRALQRVERLRVGTGQPNPQPPSPPTPAGARSSVVKRKTPGVSKTPGVWAEDLGKGIKLEMVRIPGGEFMMGSPQYEAERTDDEGPQHLVRVPEFFLGKYAVTQAQWNQVAALPKQQRDLKPAPAHFKGAKHPVESVSWDDAQEFCARLSKASGKLYRLPSEAEWEYACRAGTTTPFSFGETISTDLANYRGQDWKIGDTIYPGKYGSGQLGSFREETTDVGSFPANAFGLYDMHGNVWEWCEDEWYESYEGAPTDGSAWKNSNKSDELYRLLRGGSWSCFPRGCRSAIRRGFHRGSGSSIGFRVACRVSPRT